MKIVYVSNIPSPYQIEWAKILRKDYEVEFWFMTDIANSATGRPAYWNIELPEYCRVLPSKFKKGELCYGPTLRKELQKFNPDIVWLHGAWYMISWFQTYRWAVKNKKKIIAGPAEFEKSMYKYFKIIRNKLIYNFFYSKIDLFLANAYIHYDYLKEIIKTKNNVLFMNFDNYSPYLNHQVRQIKENVIFMYGGAISRRFRIPELLFIFEKIALRHNNARLVIGGYGPEKEKCKQIIESSNTLSRSVLFHDVQSWDEIPEVYKKCDVLINYANYSPGSGVILSAVASGMGIISSISVNSTRHFVIDKYNGYIVCSENEMFNAMERYLLNQEYVKLHSFRSKEIGYNTLTLDIHLNDFREIINNLLSKK